jgi:hypothetical protein
MGCANLTRALGCGDIDRKTGNQHAAQRCNSFEDRVLGDRVPADEPVLDLRYTRSRHAAMPHPQKVFDFARSRLIEQKGK